MVRPTFGYAPKMRHSTNPYDKVYLCDHAHQLEYYANYYVNIEITGYKVLYIAGKGVARLISWLGTERPIDCFNRTLDCYIRVYRSF